MREELCSSPQPAWSRSNLRSRACLHTAPCSSSHLDFLKRLGYLSRFKIHKTLFVPSVVTCLLYSFCDPCVLSRPVSVLRENMDCPHGMRLRWILRLVAFGLISEWRILRAFSKKICESGMTGSNPYF